MFKKSLPLTISHYPTKSGDQYKTFIEKWHNINSIWPEKDFTVKFICSEKATKFCEISTVDLSYVVPVKSTVEISQNFVAFSEYMNFKRL